MPDSKPASKADIAGATVAAGTVLVSAAPGGIPVAGPTFDTTDSTFRPLGIKEHTGTGNVIAHFGRMSTDPVPIYQSLIEFWTFNVLVTGPGHDQKGMGQIVCRDHRDGMPERAIGFGCWDYGGGIYLAGGPGDCLEVATPDGGFGFRCLALDGTRSLVENRMISDDNGLCFHTTSEQEPGDGQDQIGLPHSGQYGPGGYIYWRHHLYTGPTIHGFDGTGLSMSVGGTILVGGKLIEPGHPVSPLTRAQWASVPAYPLDVQFTGGSSGVVTDLSLGFFGDFNVNVIDYKIRRKAGATADLVIGPASGGAPVESKCYQINADGAHAIGGATDNTYKLKVYGTGQYTGALTIPTAAPGTNTTQAATTAYVQVEIATAGALKANLAAPTFSGLVTINSIAIPLLELRHASEARVNVLINGNPAFILNVDGGSCLLGTYFGHPMTIQSSGQPVLVWNSSLNATFISTVAVNGVLSAVAGVAIGGGTTTTLKRQAVATLDFPEVAAQGQQILTITVTGAAVGDRVALGPPATLEPGLTCYGRVSATNTIEIVLSNITAAPINPASASWTAGFEH